MGQRAIDVLESMADIDDDLRREGSGPTWRSLGSDIERRELIGRKALEVDGDRSAWGDEAKGVSDERSHFLIDLLICPPSPGQLQPGRSAMGRPVVFPTSFVPSTPTGRSSMLAAPSPNDPSTPWRRRIGRYPRYTDVKVLSTPAAR